MNLRPALVQLQKTIRDNIYGLIPPSVPTGQLDGADPNVARLASAFSRYASTTQTAFDTGSAQSSSAGGVNLLERQAERALSQVLGRAPGRAADSFIAALNDAFPITANGFVSASPSRNVVSVYSPNTPGSATGSWQADAVTRQAIGAGLIGQLSVEQAALYREASTISADLLRVLAGIEPFAPVVDRNAVEMLRSLVASEIKSLTEEFGRVDLPRAERVQAYFDLLVGSNQGMGHLTELGKRALIDGSWDPTSETEEAQLAAYRLIQQYVGALQNAWAGYNSASSPALVFSQSIQEASRMLAVVAEATNNVTAAMDSIGFTENERRSVGATFSTLKFPANVPAIVAARLTLPNLTVYDLTSWFDTLTNVEGQSTLADSGFYGLDFVTGQADSLFFSLAAILYATRLGPASGTLLQQVLVHERVGWELDNLFFQVKTLADLAA